MIPSMQEEGYDGGYASAVQAVGGIFGPLIPPSILMVLYGVASGESVGDMLLAGLVPGLFLGVIVTAVVVWQCIKKGYKGVGHFSLKRAAKIIFRHYMGDTCACHYFRRHLFRAVYSNRGICRCLFLLPYHWFVRL